MKNIFKKKESFLIITFKKLSLLMKRKYMPGFSSYIQISRAHSPLSWLVENGERARCCSPATLLTLPDSSQTNAILFSLDKWIDVKNSNLEKNWLDFLQRFVILKKILK